MENKKEVKVSLVTFLFIIALIVIAIMGFYIYKLTNKIEKDTQAVVTNVNEEDLSTDMLMTMAKETLDKYNELNIYENSNIGALPELFVKLGLATDEEMKTLCESQSEYDPSEDIKSNVLYEDFKAAMLNYFSEEYFNENYSQYVNMDGYAGFNNCAGDFIPTSVEAIKLIKQEENNYTFVVTLKDLEVYDHYLAGEEISEDEIFFKNIIVLKRVNDKLVVHEVTYISEE